MKHAMPCLDTMALALDLYSDMANTDVCGPTAQTAADQQLQETIARYSSSSTKISSSTAERDHCKVQQQQQERQTCRPRPFCHSLAVGTPPSAIRALHLQPQANL